ncbi:Pkinase-domain-containing protein [Cristinia sonorae]|uniref:non-specific serine/threonine protein kinase n=1 Tax=Cristinia sonorae TaxID=1940300 RepID=A0A8K0UMB2_9AGAR|nr:Pkinase-domain-containing protein [Cristinia sonorae]
MVQFSAILPVFSGRIISAPGVRLELKDILGSGAYGVVYLAQDLSDPLAQPPALFAVKCLLRHPDGSDYARAQEREIVLHKAASPHPNVVTLHHVITEERYIYLVMDYCPGGDLFGAIIDWGTFEGNDDAIKKVFLQLIDAVDFCHDLGIYHRDLKPENIMCSANFDQVYLSDFGLATQVAVSNTFGCGSSYYMSPECLGIMTSQAPFCTRESDVWSLGVILNNMVTGRNPWHVASPANDEGFRQFLAEGADYLLQALPISRSAANLFSRVFDPNPVTRITLSQLRKATLEVDSFSHPGRPYCTPVPPPQTQHVHVVPHHPAGHPHRGAPTVDIIIPEGTDLDAFPLPPPLDPSSPRHGEDSSNESAGPITPPTVTQNPTIADAEPLNASKAFARNAGQGGGGLRGNRKRVFAAIGLGIGTRSRDRESCSGSGSRLSRKLRQYRIGESAQRFVGVMRELKLRA